MAAGERGFIGREIDDLNSHQRFLTGLQDSAERLLLARLDPLPERDGGKRWRRLDRDGQNRIGTELVQMAELANDPRGAVAQVVAADLTPPAPHRLSDAMTGYRESLPYSGAEYRWLGRSRRTVEGQQAFSRGGYIELVDWIMGQREEIVSGGRTVEATGAELITRGWDWMRGAGRFRRDSTYEAVTLNALWRIAMLFDRDTPARQRRPELRSLSEFQALTDSSGRGGHQPR